MSQVWLPRVVRATEDPREPLLAVCSSCPQGPPHLPPTTRHCCLLTLGQATLLSILPST